MSMGSNFLKAGGVVCFLGGLFGRMAANPAGGFPDGIMLGAGLGGMFAGFGMDMAEGKK